MAARLAGALKLYDELGSPMSTLDVVVEKKLVGMRPEANFIDLPRPLIVEVGFNHIPGKDVSSEKEFMVLLECVERFL